MAARAGATGRGAAAEQLTSPGGSPAVAGHTYAFRRLPLEPALDELSLLGFRSVEVWLGHVPGSPDLAAAALAQRGLAPAAVSAGGFYEHGGASPERAFEVAAGLGCTRLVACVSPARLSEVVALLPPGLALCLENHWDQQLARPADLLRVLGPLGPEVGACLDTGHALLAGARPERFARLLGRRLLHVHLKDASPPTALERLAGRRLRRRLHPRPEPVAPGHGALDLRRLAAALSEVGYAGTVTFEDEGEDPAGALAELAARWAEAEATGTRAAVRG